MEKPPFKIEEPPSPGQEKKQAKEDRGGFVKGGYWTKEELKEERKREQEDPHRRWEQP